MKLAEYIQCDAIALAELIKNKSIRPDEPLACAIKLTEQLNPKINAVIANYYDLAYNQLARSNPNAPLFGVPTLIKDLYFALQGTTQTNGSRYYRSNISTETCAFASQLLHAGALIYGKTNTAELGLSYTCESQLFGACKNPWDTSLSPGGSSGGSAAAVAARIVPFAAGNDSGGSLRTPASCCGLFGFKPSNDSTPHSSNEAEQWSGLLCNHVITRSVRDSAMIFDIMNKSNISKALQKEHRQSNNKHLRIALLSGVFQTVDIHIDCLAAVEKAAQLAERFGHFVEPVCLNIDIEKLDQSLFKLIAANILQLLTQQQQRCGHGFHEQDIELITQAFANAGRQISSEELTAAKLCIRKLIKPLQQLFTDYDLVLTPALAKPHIPLGHLRHEDDLNIFMQKCSQFSPFTGIFNQTGQPAMTLPVITDDQQLPISVQFAAKHHHESLLFQLAYQFERANPWQTQIPSILNSANVAYC